MNTGYQCDNCGGWTQDRWWIFNCVECGKEVCVDCFYGWATCKECAKSKTDGFLKKRFAVEVES